MCIDEKKWQKICRLIKVPLVIRKIRQKAESISPEGNSQAYERKGEIHYDNIIPHSGYVTNWERRDSAWINEEDNKWEDLSREEEIKLGRLLKGGYGLL